VSGKFGENCTVLTNICKVKPPVNGSSILKVHLCMYVCMYAHHSQTITTYVKRNARMFEDMYIWLAKNHQILSKGSEKHYSYEQCKSLQRC